MAKCSSWLRKFLANGSLRQDSGNVDFGTGTGRMKLFEFFVGLILGPRPPGTNASTAKKKENSGIRDEKLGP